MRRLVSLTLIGMAALAGTIAACGSSSTEDAAAAFAQSIAESGAAAPRRSLSVPVPQPAAQAANAPVPTAAELFDWAGYRYPELFQPKPQGPDIRVDYLGQTYTVRAYDNGNYLGLTSDGRIYGLGPFTDHALTGFGQAADYAEMVAADRCAVYPGTCPAAPTATIDSATVTRALDDFAGFAAVCSDPATGAMRASRRVSVAVALGRAGQRLERTVPRSVGKTRLALGTTPPADELGSCGGRWGYRNYVHLNGVTTATLSFENYCQDDSDTGERETVNGAVSFVNTATPGADGPVTTQVTADTTQPVTITVRSASGDTLSAQSISFTGFRMAVGVPDGTPTVDRPDVLSLAEMSVRNLSTGKTYRQSNYELRQYQTQADESVMTFSGRGHRSDGSSFDIATTDALVIDGDGDWTSGTITTTGANGTRAVAAVVPGSEMQLSLTVNGTPVTSLPACQR